MALHAGERLGPYVVTGSIGSGGMGEVFKAHDTRLNRFVALKVIAGGLDTRADFRQRFLDEARAIAALNHPHICALYDTGQDNGRDYLVMEYLEGESLADKLARGPLGFRELLGWAIEIAEAMDYAHRHGIIHRDLKPANVFIMRSGGAKLLDFGLAAMRGAVGSGGLSSLATKPVHVTAQGSVVGTLHYIPPERLEGREADRRSDIFAFGTVLYEMLTRRKAFDGATQAELITAILSRDPEAIDPSNRIPPEMQTIVQNCLAKNPDDRWQCMADVAKILKGVGLRLASGQPSFVEAPARSWKRGAAAAGVLVTLLVLTLTALNSLRDATTSREGVVSFPVPPPPDGSMALSDSTVQSAQFALAPDGRALVFVATTGAGTQLWVRALDRTDARPLQGTGGAAYPFWSPDSRMIGFFADRRLKKIPAGGGPAEDICEATNGRGGTWNKNGDIVFAPENTNALYRVSASGGVATQLAALPPHHSGHRWPQFFPDGRHLLFLVKSAQSDVEGIYVTSLDVPGEARRLRGAATNGLYASGRLLYVLDGTLVVQSLDPEKFVLSGESVALGLPVSVSTSYYSGFSVVETGVLATWSGDSSSELVWFDRKGHRLGTVEKAGRYVDFRLSPDEQRLALARVDSGANAPDIWIVDLTRNMGDRIVSTARTDATPVWAPDGGRIVFRSNRRHARHELFERPAHTGGEDHRLFESEAGLYPTDWSADSSSIVYHERRADTGYDISLLDLRSRTTRLLVHTRYEEAQGQLDAGRRLAYTSNEAEDFNVYVRPLDSTQGAVRISPSGGADPRWRADGRELFYLSPRGELVAAEITDPPFRVGRLTRLLTVKLPLPSSPYLSNFVATRNGQRFLVRVPIDSPEASPITLTLNWSRRLPAGS